MVPQTSNNPAIAIVGGAVAGTVVTVVVIAVLLVILLWFIFLQKTRKPITTRRLTLNYKAANPHLSSDHAIHTATHNDMVDNIEYVDVDAEIQKEREERLSDSLIEEKQLQLIDKLGEGISYHVV